jgi:multiple sugar transport system substrate-binding protein
MKKLLLIAAALLAACSPPPDDPSRTEITLMRFFGSCESKFGNVNDVRQGVGECGIVTTLVNEFNATNGEGIVVRTQIGEWGPYYDQLTARLVAKDIPTVAVMHESALGDYVRRKLVLPLDEDFTRIGIPVDDFTEHARRGVSFGGEVHALPFDTWAWLWHLNTGLFKQAGLTEGGKARLPRSPEELIAQAEQFKQRTGKPYFAWAVANETAANFRSFLSLVAQQGAPLFSNDGKTIDMKQPAVTNALTLMQRLYAEGHVKPHLDYASANQAFLSGEVGVLLVGTWTLDQFLREADKPGSALAGGYEVVPFPRLYQRNAVFADGHAWALFEGGAKTERHRQAALKFLKFVWSRSGEWARTGHLPVSRTVAESPAFQQLPLREGLTEITETGVGMPGNVPTQRAIELLIGEDVANLMLSNKPVAEVQANVEKRVNTALKRARR